LEAAALAAATHNPSTPRTMTTIEQHCQALVDRLQEKAEDGITFDHHTTHTYVRITRSDLNRPFAYVNKQTGALYLAKSKDGPQKSGPNGGVRYDLMDPQQRQECFRKAEPSGQFLYQIQRHWHLIK